MDTIQISHLIKKFPGTTAVDDISLSIPPGMIFGLVGSDGAGKTTTLRLLVGALKPDSGEISICGLDIQKNMEQARSKIGYLSQRFSLYEDLTVMENIHFFAELRGLKRKEWLTHCRETLDFVGLSEFMNRPAGQLSGGMKQKLGLASALVTRPQVLLLDEPTTGVDPVTRQDFWQLVMKLVSSHSLPSTSMVVGENFGRAVILTTPYMDEAARCHRVGFMRQGKIIIEGTPSGLRSHLEGRILEIRGSSLQNLRQSALLLPGVEEVHMFGDRLHLRVNQGALPDVMEKISHLRVDNTQLQVRQVPPTLEDIFISVAN